MPPIAAPAIQTAAPLPCGRHRPWHCVIAKPNQTIRARDALENAGFPSFLPLQTRTNPLFGRYFFAAPDENDQWVGMLYQPGVAEVIRDGIGVPRPVPESVMAYLRGRCDDTGILIPHRIEIGDTVVIPSGAWADHIGLCTRTERERIWLLLEILGRKQEIPFERGALEVNR